MMNNWIISSSVTIAAVLAVRFALRGRISLSLQYALWLVVLVRLLIPFQLFHSPISTAAVSDRVDLSAPVREVYFSANEELYEQEYDATYRETLQYYESRGQQADPVVAEQRAAEKAQQSLELNMESELFMLWLLGMAVMAAVIIACNLHLALRLRRSRRALDTPDCLLPVYVTAAVPTPCIFGFFRPAIYLTPGAAEDETVLRHALTHELTHYRHLDHVWSVLRSLCLVLHWYNPLAWLAARVSRADGELACDEGALGVLGEEHRGDYGRTLIGLTCEQQIGSIFLSATTMTGSAGSLRERLKLLMKRPKTTTLTLSAALLLVTVIVGCTFGTAPNEPTETTPAVTQPTETTQPGIDLEQLQEELEGADYVFPAADFRDDGQLVFPGTKWGMTEAQLLEALDIQEYGTFSGMRGIHLPNAVFCGQPASIAFYFTQNDSFSQWGLSSVRVQLRDEPAANEVFRALHESLAGSAVQTETAAYAEWWSDSSLAPGSGSEDESDAVSLIQWFGSGDPELEHTVWFFSSLIQRIEPVLDPTVQPVLDGYALSMQEALTEYAGKNPRLLTQEEIDRVNEAYAHTVYDAETDSLSVLPAASFFTSCYDDVRKLDFGEFLRYFPISGEATEEEFQLLREKYGAEFAFAECETLLDMPVPVHRYETGHIDTAFRRYAGLPFQEFQNRGDVYYLEETGCFYNFTSDFGPGMFPCVDGFVYDGGAILYSESRALYLTEQNGRYYIQAHLPLDIG